MYAGPRRGVGSPGDRRGVVPGEADCSRDEFLRDSAGIGRPSLRHGLDVGAPVGRSALGGVLLGPRLRHARGVATPTFTRRRAAVGEQCARRGCSRIRACARTSSCRARPDSSCSRPRSPQAANRTRHAGPGIRAGPGSAAPPGRRAGNARPRAPQGALRGGVQEADATAQQAASGDGRPAGPCHPSTAPAGKFRPTRRSSGRGARGGARRVGVVAHDARGCSPSATHCGCAESLSSASSTSARAEALAATFLCCFSR